MFSLGCHHGRNRCQATLKLRVDLAAAALPEHEILALGASRATDRLAPLERHFFYVGIVVLFADQVIPCVDPKNWIAGPFLRFFEGGELNC